MKKNIKKIAEELHAMNDSDFESFIAEQILSSKSSHIEEPCFSLSNSSMTLDVWKKKSNYEVVKSVLPGTKTSEKDFTKTMKKKELLEEIIKIVDSFLE